jgi:hypothetical protein
MTLDYFINKYNGKGIDWDGQYGFQCVDLYRKYVHEVLNLPQSKPIPAAADIWNNYLTDRFERIPNTPTGVPLKGDIVIWKKAASLPYGHVAIFVSGNVNSFTSFDQNWPTGSLCHLQTHNYTNVLGWLRAKASTSETVPAPTPPPPPVETVTLEKYQTDIGSKNVEIETFKKQLDNLKILYDRLREEYNDISEALINERNDALNKLVEKTMPAEPFKTDPETAKTPPKTVTAPEVDIQLIIANQLIKLYQRVRSWLGR